MLGASMGSIVCIVTTRTADATEKQPKKREEEEEGRMRSRLSKRVPMKGKLIILNSRNGDGTMKLK